MAALNYWPPLSELAAHCSLARHTQAGEENTQAAPALAAMTPEEGDAAPGKVPELVPEGGKLTAGTENLEASLGGSEHRFIYKGFSL